MQPGASVTTSRRSSTSSESVPFATPPSSPLTSPTSRIPKPTPVAPPFTAPSFKNVSKARAATASAAAAAAAAVAATTNAAADAGTGKVSARRPSNTILPPQPDDTDDTEEIIPLAPSKSAPATESSRDRRLSPRTAAAGPMSRTGSSDSIRSIRSNVSSQSSGTPRPQPRLFVTKTNGSSSSSSSRSSVTAVVGATAAAGDTVGVGKAGKRISRIVTKPPPLQATSTPKRGVASSSTSSHVSSNGNRTPVSPASPPTPSISVHHPTPPRGSSNVRRGSSDQRSSAASSVRGRKAASSSSRPASDASGGSLPAKPTTSSSASSSRAASPRTSPRTALRNPPSPVTRLPQLGASASSRTNRRLSLQPPTSPASSLSPSSSPTLQRSQRSHSPAKRSPLSPKSPLISSSPTSSSIPRLTNARRSPIPTSSRLPAPRGAPMTRTLSAQDTHLRPSPPPAVPAKSPLRQLRPPAPPLLAPAPTGLSQQMRRRTMQTPAPIVIVPLAQALPLPMPSAATTITTTTTTTRDTRSDTPVGDEGGRQTPTSSRLSVGYPPGIITSRSPPPSDGVDPTTPTSTEIPFPSASSIDDPSAPPSAPPDSSNHWVVGALDKVTHTPEEMPLGALDPAASRNDATPRTPTDENIPQWHDKALPAVPGTIAAAAVAAVTIAPLPVNSITPGPPQTPTTPVRPTHGPSPMAARSPSMPSLGAGHGRPRGATESSPSVPRSQVAMVKAGLIPTPQPRPQSMMLPSAPSSPVTAVSTPLSRRAHLIREIANTERAHATDLALIVDAYLARESPLVGSRPDSQHSSITQTSSTDTSSAGTPGLVEGRPGMKRNSSYGMPVEELRRPGVQVQPPPPGTERLSGHEGAGVNGPWSTAWNGIKSPGRKQPQLSPMTNGSMDPLVSPAATSTSSVSSVVFPSPRYPTPQSSVGTSTPSIARATGVGRPLSPADVKAVFLNLAQLAVLSDELATGFERALGQLDSEIGSPVETGADCLGEMFCETLPKIRPLYMFYCSRQSAASARLVELQADPSYAAYLNECWGLVKARTHAWNLDSMLIKPVQRITKYPLLFEDLLTCTMPSHADYHAIRSSAESARSLALDIDEAKRRKDVITSVIGKSSSTINLMKDGRGNGATGRGGLLLRRFKKDKSTPLSAGISPSDPMGPPPEIAPYSQAQLKELVHRLENSDRNIRRLGKEFVDWVAATKVMLRQEIEIQSRLVTWYGIDDKDKEPHIEKVVQYKALLEDMLTNSLEQVNAEVSNSVLPMVGKLIDAATNPTTIIEKLNKKAADYGRYIAHRNAKKAVPDRMLLQEATDYVAIHTQLLEELPAFLDGYTKIIDIAVATFTMAQMRYYGTFRARLTDFSERYLTVPTEQIADADGIRDALIDLSNIRGIHRAWVGAFREPNNAMKSLECTSGDMSRMGSASRANSRRMNSSSRPASRASGVGSNLIYPPLQHTSSLSSQQSRTPTEDSQSTGGRRRSSSLTAAYDTVRSTGSEGRSGLSGIMWRGSRNNSATNLAGLVNATPNRSRTNLSILPLNRSKSRNKTHSIASQEEEGRQSFGLPRIPMNDSLFDSLTSASPSPSPARNSGASYSDSSETHFSALGFGEPAGMHSHSHSLSHSLGDSVAESWRNSPVLYQCAAVADFLPIELGNHKFQGLYFLPLVAGDLVDVYHEIGRVADLYDFPYSQVGVENDGAVVCRAENGVIGVAMCSFLEPLRS